MKRKFKMCLAIINADTESTVEGYMSAFIAKRCETRLRIREVPGGDEYINEAVNSINYTIRTTQQDAVITYFAQLQKVCENVHEFVSARLPRYDADQIEIYYVVHFANMNWDLEVLKGILFHDTKYEMTCVGDSADLVQLKWGFIIFHDFLRLTGFRSIRMAGMICFNAHKLDGEEVYRMTKKDIPEKYEDYSETKKAYIENDVDVMNESLNIMLNRRENETIIYTHQLPSTATGFSRWRMNNDPAVIEFDGKRHSTYAELNAIWRTVRPFLAFFMRAYKGGLSGVHPVSQYKLLRDIVCFDAVSMYPHKMLYFRMMQPHYTGKTYESDLPLEDDKEAQRLWNNILHYTADLDPSGLPNWEPDRSDKGILPWVGEVEISIHGLRRTEAAMMIPCLSKYKVELTPQELHDAEKGENPKLISANGKILYCEHVTVITTSVDLYLMNLCYDMDVHAIRTVVYMQWQYMTFLQKRDVWEAYKRKMHVSAVANKGQDENDEYWIQEAGFNPAAIRRMAPDEYKTFLKAYKGMIKADPNGKYGLTVECPIHAETTVDKDPELIFNIRTTKSVFRKCIELIREPELAPDHIKNNDYCAGSSITMWARWHLLLLTSYLFRHGHQVHYTDTDSIFVDDCQEVRELVKSFNAWMYDHYHTSCISDIDEEQIDYAETGNIGMMDEDKICRFFMAMGAKCYAYIDVKNRPQVTVAGLNAANYKKWMEKQMEEGEPVQGMLLKWFRPNTFITPEGTTKLLMVKDGEGFDEEGLWKGPVLHPVGFQLVNTASHFHCHNMRMAAYLQGLPEDYYIGKYTSSSALFVTDTGIYNASEYEEYKNRDDLYTDLTAVLEDQQPIKGGMIAYALSLQPTQ